MYGLSRSCSVKNAAAFAADDAARHADQLFDADGAVAVFGHVDADHLGFVAEHEFSDRLCQLRLADAGRAEEQQHAVRRVVIILERALVEPQPFRDRPDGLVLSDDAIRKIAFHR